MLGCTRPVGMGNRLCVLEKDCTWTPGHDQPLADEWQSLVPYANKD